MKQTTMFLLREVQRHHIAFHMIKIVTKKRAIMRGRIQATNVFTMKIEFAKNEELNSARKQSKEIIVSVVWPNTYPAENVSVRAFGNWILKFIAADAV